METLSAPPLLFCPSADELSVLRVVSQRRSSEELFIKIYNCQSPPPLIRANVYVSRLAVNTELRQAVMRECESPWTHTCVCVCV